MMCLWPETGPDGRQWYARWFDEDGAKKVSGQSRGEAISNCVGDVEAAIVWDEAVIHQRHEAAWPEQMNTPSPMKTAASHSEVNFLEAACQAILTPSVASRIADNVDNEAESEQLTELPSTTRLLPWMTRVWNWTLSQLGSQQSKKRLRLCETVSLGEKRFVAVLDVDGQQFLVGGASGSVATLARLDPSPQFSEVLKRQSQDQIQA